MIKKLTIIFIVAVMKLNLVWGDELPYRMRSSNVIEHSTCRLELDWKFFYTSGNASHEKMGYSAQKEFVTLLGMKGYRPFALFYDRLDTHLIKKGYPAPISRENDLRLSIYGELFIGNRRSLREFPIDGKLEYLKQIYEGSSLT